MEIQMPMAIISFNFNMLYVVSWDLGSSEEVGMGNYFNGFNCCKMHHMKGEKGIPD
jgi:hypothetical protein